MSYPRNNDRPPAEADEFTLSPVLRDLGEQLSVEADRLADQYPPLDRGCAERRAPSVEGGVCTPPVREQIEKGARERGKDIARPRHGEAGRSWSGTLLVVLLVALPLLLATWRWRQPLPGGDRPSDRRRVAGAERR